MYKDYQKKYQKENRENLLIKRRIYRENNREKIRRIAKEYNNKPEVKEKRRQYEIHNREKIKKNKKESGYNKKYYAKNREKIKENRKEWLKKPENRKKINARNFAKRCIKIKKEDKCEVCKVSGAEDRHHENYDKPLEVVLVCKSCHKKIHFP